MKAFVGLLLGLAVALLPGCTLVPTTEYNACQAENRNLADQNRAQLAEIENLKVHSRDLEDRVIRSERQVARVQEQDSLDQKQLEAYQCERDGLYEQFNGMAYGRGRMPPELGRQFAELSQRYPNLQFDPETGISKLDTDILFDSGEAVLKPGAEQVLDELARILRSPAAGSLKIMVAGHTDNQMIVGPAVRERYPNNFHLSTGRCWPWPTGCVGRACPSNGWPSPVSVPISRSPRTPPPATVRRTGGWISSSWPPRRPWLAGATRRPASTAAACGASGPPRSV